jgi:uncharacterized protein (TIGR02266 family)
MSAEKRIHQRVATVIRLKLKYPDVGTFIDKFATNLSSRGMFISSRAPKPVGTVLRFELRLAGQSTLVSGTGIVRWTQPYSKDRPRELHGMGIEFTDVSPESSEVLSRIIVHRQSMGLAEDALPRATEAGYTQPPEGADEETTSISPPPVKRQETPPAEPLDPDDADDDPSAEPLDLDDAAFEAALKRARHLAATTDPDVEALAHPSKIEDVESSAHASIELDRLLASDE